MLKREGINVGILLNITVLYSKTEKFQYVLHRHANVLPEAIILKHVTVVSSYLLTNHFFRPETLVHSEQ